MTEQEAVTAMVPLTIAFGFTEDSYAQWLGFMQELSDPLAASRAAHSLAKEAEGTFVPGWKVFQNAYDRWLRRTQDERAEERRALESGELSKSRYPSFEEGVKIAWASYQDECRLRGKDPNVEYFQSIMSGVARQQRREARRAKARR